MAERKQKVEAPEPRPADLVAAAETALPRLEAEARELLEASRGLLVRDLDGFRAACARYAEVEAGLKLAHGVLRYATPRVEAEAERATLRRRQGALQHATDLLGRLRGARREDPTDERIAVATYGLATSLRTAVRAEPALMSHAEAGATFGDGLPARESPRPWPRPFTGRAPWASLVAVISGTTVGLEADRVLAEWSPEPILRALGVGATETAEA